MAEQQRDDPRVAVAAQLRARRVEQNRVHIVGRAGAHLDRLVEGDAHRRDRGVEQLLDRVVAA